MSKGYWIVRVDVTDQEQFKKYAAANADAFKNMGLSFSSELANSPQSKGLRGHETQSWNFRLTK